jgi:hypothetical protein
VVKVHRAVGAEKGEGSWSGEMRERERGGGWCFIFFTKKMSSGGIEPSPRAVAVCVGGHGELRRE